MFVPDGRGDLQTTFGPEDVFHYAYAVFHSPTYRQRYAEFLKIDFPRLPLTHDRTLFATLVRHGGALVDLHLLRLPGAGSVGGNGGAAILVDPGAQGLRFPTGGDNRIEKVQYAPPTTEHEGRVYMNARQCFEGIQPETRTMQIGGHQPLEKWLKDRRGRVLSFDDVQHHLRVAIALRETHRLMATINVLIPAWPLS